MSLRLIMIRKNKDRGWPGGGGAPGQMGWKAVDGSLRPTHT
jgi:hypothetical protein